MNDDLNTLLRGYGHRIAEACVSERKRVLYESLLKAIGHSIADCMETTNVSSHRFTNALYYWSEQPFLFSSFPVQDTFLSIAVAKDKEGSRG